MRVNLGSLSTLLDVPIRRWSYVADCASSLLLVAQTAKQKCIFRQPGDLDLPFRWHQQVAGCAVV